MNGTAGRPWVILGLLAGWVGVAPAVRAVLGTHHHDRRSDHESVQ